MKKLISALMLAALASGSLAMTENQSLAAATHGRSKARHSMVKSKQTKARAKKSTTSRKRRASRKTVAKKPRASKKTGVGKVVRAHKARSHKARAKQPATNPAVDGDTPLPISQ